MTVTSIFQMVFSPEHFLILIKIHQILFSVVLWVSAEGWSLHNCPFYAKHWCLKFVIMNNIELGAGAGCSTLCRLAMLTFHMEFRLNSGCCTSDPSLWCTWKAAKDDPSPWALFVGDLEETQVSWLWTSSGHCGYLGNEPAHGRPFSITSSNSVNLPFK